MKKILSLFLSACFVFGIFMSVPVVNAADIVTNGDWRYVLASEESVGGGTANYDGGGIALVGYTGNSANVVIPSSLDGYDVTVLSTKLLYNHSEIVSLVVPDTVKCIRSYALANLTGLKSLELRCELVGFADHMLCCTESSFKLDSLACPISYLSKDCSGIDVVWNSLLWDCSTDGHLGIDFGNIDTLHLLPDSNSGYDNTDNYWNVDLADYEMPRIKSNYGPKTLIIDEGVVTLPEGICVSFSRLENVELPSTLRVVGPFAFFGCKNLKEVSFPNSLEQISNYAFEKCSSLSKVYLDSGVNSIGTRSFPDTTELIYNSAVPQSILNRASAGFKNILTSNAKYVTSNNAYTVGKSLPRDGGVGGDPYSLVFSKDMPTEIGLDGAGPYISAFGSKTGGKGDYVGINVDYGISLNKEDTTFLFNVACGRTGEYKVDSFVNTIVCYRDAVAVIDNDPEANNEHFRLMDINPVFCNSCTLPDGFEFPCKNVIYLEDVTFDANGGALPNGNTSDTYVYLENESVDLSLTAQKDGYTFVGWSLSPDAKFVTDDFTVISDVTLYAVYREKYSVSFDANGGQGFMSDVYSMSDIINLPENCFYKEGCIFKGWVIDKDQKNIDFADKQVLSFTDLGSDDVTLYAVWNSQDDLIGDIPHDMESNEYDEQLDDSTFEDDIETDEDLDYDFSIEDTNPLDETIPTDEITSTPDTQINTPSTHITEPDTGKDYNTSMKSPNTGCDNNVVAGVVALFVSVCVLVFIKNKQMKGDSFDEV